MLRRGTSITGKTVGPHRSAGKTIKPSKTRKIIRRYHFLTQTQQKLLALLKLGPQALPTLASGDRAFQKGMSTTQGDETVEKELIQAQKAGQDAARARLLLGYVYRELQDEKGLANYQLASKQGQDARRGGDSSKVLIEWMRELEESGPLSALEIGSLSKHNKISTSGIFNPVVRIDLNNSNDAEGITKQDFMQRPLPRSDADRFDLVSCSLVLNFVPTPGQRGAMCERFSQFLKRDSSSPGYVFIVLPLPCLDNSRYMTKEHFDSIMEALGYTPKRYHAAKKVCYALYTWNGDNAVPTSARKAFTKRSQLRDGPGMNNFSIQLG